MSETGDAEVAELQGAIKLLEYALFLRMNGERPPGAPHDQPEAETWHDWDRRAEAFLRACVPGDGPGTQEARRRQSVYERYAYGTPGIRL